MNRAVSITAAGCLLASGAIHLWLAPEHIEEMPYIGWLFVAGGLALLVVAAAVWAGDRLTAWRAGAVLCAIMVAALVASRTVGLPGGYLEEWDPAAVWSLTIETAFLGLYLIRRQLVASTGKAVRR